LAVIALPQFNEVRAPRPAIRDQPSPSKPVIPMRRYYITLVTSLQMHRASFLKKRVSGVQ
jgi:hypothetical protein